MWVVVVDDPAKDYLPDEFRPTHIEKDCAALFQVSSSLLSQGSYTFEAPAIRGAADTVWSVLKQVRCLQGGVTLTFSILTLSLFPAA